MRLILKLILAVMVLAVFAVGAIFLLPGERLAAIATDQISKATGRKVVLSGDVRPSLYPQLGVTTGPVRVAGADWAGTTDLITAESLAVGVDLIALLRGRVAVQQAEFVSPSIYLQRATDGRVNWETAKGAPTQDGPQGDGAAFGDFTFDAIKVSNAQITWRDDQAGQMFDLSSADVVVKPAGAGLSVDLTGQLNGQALTVAATVSDVQALLNAAATGVDLNVAVAGATMTFVGEGSQTGQASGQFTFQTPDLDGPLRALGQVPVALPAELAGTIAVTGDLTADAHGASIAGGRYQVGPFAASGPVKVILEDRVRVSGDLRAGRLDLTPFMGDSGDSASGTAASGWSDAAIDASGLAAVDADLSLSAEAIDLGTTALGPTLARLALDSGRLVATVERTVAFGAPVAGEVVVNSRGGVSMRANLRGDGLDMKQVLSDVVGFDRLSGTGAMSVSLLTSGPSMAQMMARVDGDVRFSISEGELAGVDLEALLQGQPANGGTTVIQGLSAPFTVEDGVMLSDAVTLNTPLVETRTRGQINLAAQTLDLTTRRVKDGAERGIPVRVVGPWAKPKIYPDLEAAAKAELDKKLAAEKARVEARIEQEKERLEQQVQDKVAEELGVQLEEGQSLEDAAKSKLEQELQRGLGRLLGGN